MEYSFRADSTDPFWQNNLVTAMCRFCDLSATCKKDEIYPKVSPLSGELLKWYNEFEAGFCTYPNGGTWQHQYPWFNSGIDTIRSTIARLRAEQRKDDERRARNVR